MEDLFTKTKNQIQQNLPFVLFCKPNSDHIIGLFQKNDVLYLVENFEEKGFVFAPFYGDIIPIIPQNQSDVYVEKKTVGDFYVNNNNDFVADEAHQIGFENLVEKAVTAIQSGAFQKVVVSRKETIKTNNLNTEMVFKKLIAYYPSAFNYCFFHPKIGMWMGATPEQLLKVNEDQIATVALAGTQIFNSLESVVWQEKEKNEQQLVTDFIASQLADFVFNVNISKPYSAQAGNLWHIKTDISARLLSKYNLKQVLHSLHPTPAVGGLPKASAKAFILKNEAEEREYYSGFLGELNINLATFKTESSDLFVNLRCMKILNNVVELFVGCGVTKDSIPKNEYAETVNKSMTMKRAL